MRSNNIFQSIQYVDISLDTSTDLVKWINGGATLMRLDVQAARASAITNSYKHMENKSTRFTIFRKNSVTFLLAANESVQYQMSEAILEGIIQKFFSVYGTFNVESMMGLTSMFSGFEGEIAPIIQSAITENVVWVKCDCRFCKQNYEICVRKSLIKEAENYPVAFVYFHQGHGLLLYLDAQFKIRSYSTVEISA